jgi:hypothetical protein
MRASIAQRNDLPHAEFRDSSIKRRSCVERRRPAPSGELPSIAKMSFGGKSRRISLTKGGKDGVFARFPPKMRLLACGNSPKFRLASGAGAV